MRKKFEEKITYINLDQNPKGIEKVNENDNEIQKSHKYIFNSITILIDGEGMYHD